MGTYNRKAGAWNEQRERKLDRVQQYFHDKASSNTLAKKAAEAERAWRESRKLDIELRPKRSKKKKRKFYK